MKKEEAREIIRSLWRHRSESRKSINEAMLFYQELQKEHPEVLKFRSRCDKYQTVKSFIADLVLPELELTAYHR